MNTPPRQQGFAYIAAIVLLVVLATLSIALIKLNTTQQQTSTQDLLAIRATQTARAGVEWGLYRALRAGSCSGSAQTLSDFAGASGFNVTVTCTSKTFKEGQYVDPADSAIKALPKTLYKISAVACNSSSCPDDSQAGNAGYVERKRVAMACTSATGDCY